MAETNPNIVTRFAPSPTGYLHVGGARTALFSWAYARGRGGRFLLRIEDTDRKRSSEAAEQAILEDLAWLGLDWDNQGNEPRQSRHHAEGKYEQLIQALIEGGKAYPDADDPDVIRLRMDKAIDFDDAVYGRVHVEADDLEDFVIRKGKTGELFPTFHFAVVADDAAMGVTHVIRGQEHLSNTPKHAALYDALAEVTGDAEKYKRPTWAHTPSIMNPDGSKMSKRDKDKTARRAAKTYIESHSRNNFIELLNHPITTGPNRLRGDFNDEQGPINSWLQGEFDSTSRSVYVANLLDTKIPEIDLWDFKISGYLPGTLCNYLALLGWNPKDGTEHFNLDWLKQRFELTGINKSNAKFDREKLIEFNRQDIEQMPESAFAVALIDYVRLHEPELAAFQEQHEERFYWLCKAIQQRVKVFSEAAAFTGLIRAKQRITHEVNKGTKKAMLKGGAAGYDALVAVRPVLDALDEQEQWTPKVLQQTLEEFSEQQGYKNMGVVAQPLRVAVAGVPVTPPIDLTLAVVGKDETLRRIDVCLEFYKGPAEDAKANAS